MRAGFALFSFLFVLVVGCSSSDNSVGVQQPSVASSPLQPLDNSVASSASEFFVYVSVAGEKSLSVARISTDGGLTLLPESVLSVPGRAGAMAVDRQNDRLLLGVGDALGVVDITEREKPSLMSSTAVDGEPVYISIHESSGQIFSAYFGEDTVSAHTSIKEGVELQDLEESGVEPHAAVWDPTEDFLYVPHRSGDVVVWFSRDASGDLTRVGEVSVAAESGPRHMVFSSDGLYAYVVHELSDSVEVFGVGDNGELRSVQTVSTLPDEFDGADNTGADIHISPDGRYVYSSNRGHNSIAMFEVVDDGLLQKLGHQETEARPRDFTVSPDGSVLVVAGQDSGNIQSYAIGDTGILETRDVLAVGDSPVWVEILAE